MSGDLVLVECLDSHGRVTARERIMIGDDQRTFTIGRSVLADVVLSDEHAAGLHALVDVAPDGALSVSDLGSLNGLVIDGKRHAGAKSLALGGNTLQVGRTQLRIRTSREELPPEKPDQLLSAGWLHNPAWLAGIAGVAVAGQMAYTSWLGAPRDLLLSIVTMLGGTAAGVAIWVALWALLSRVMQGEWRWLRHGAIVLGVTAIVSALSGIAALGWFMFDLPDWGRTSQWLGALVMALLLYLHLRHSSNLGMRNATIVAGIIPLLVVVTVQWMATRNSAQNVNAVDATMRIYPPGLRMTSAGKIDDYFKRVAKLRAAADKKREALPPNDNGG